MNLLVVQVSISKRALFKYFLPSLPRKGVKLSNEKVICRNYEGVQENTFDGGTIKIIKIIFLFILILIYNENSKKTYRGKVL